MDILRTFGTTRKDVEIVIHIDDGIVAGPSAQVTEIKETLQGKVAMKDLGGIDEHGKKFFGKIIKEDHQGFHHPGRS